MSARGGVIPVRSPADIESGGKGDGRDGVVIPLPIERAEPVEPSGLPNVALHPISPELALIDPDLARAARELLPDRPRFAARPAVPALTEETVVVERVPDRLEPVPETSRPRPRRRRVRLLAAAGLIALGALLTLVVGRERSPAPVQQQTQAVSGTTSPSQGASPSQKAAKPKPKPAPAAAVHAAPLPGQTFAWVATPGASAYEFQLFQGGERIYRARVAKPRLVLPGRWREDGRPHALLPGNYRWYVWPVSSRTKRQASAATVQAKLVVEGQQR